MYIGINESFTVIHNSTFVQGTVSFYTGPLRVSEHFISIFTIMLREIRENVVSRQK